MVNKTAAKKSTIPLRWKSLKPPNERIKTNNNNTKIVSSGFKCVLLFCCLCLLSLWLGHFTWKYGIVLHFAYNFITFPVSLHLASFCLLLSFSQVEKKIRTENTIFDFSVNMSSLTTENTHFSTRSQYRKYEQSIVRCGTLFTKK